MKVANLMAQLEGVAYVARGAVNNAGSIAQTKKFLKRAFQAQMAGHGLSFVEILTMCPTGWFIETQEAPGYLADNLAAVHQVGVLKAVADLKIAHSGSTTRPCVTVSVGVATVEPGGDYSHEQAVREADVALYAVKERGRDGWSFNERSPADAGDLPGGDGGLLKTAS